MKNIVQKLIMHKCRNLPLVAIYSFFPQIFIEVKLLSRKVFVILQVCLDSGLVAIYAFFLSFCNSVLMAAWQLHIYPGGLLLAPLSLPSRLL